MTVERYDKSRRRTYRGDAVIAWVRAYNAKRDVPRSLVGNPARPRTLMLFAAVVFLSALVWMEVFRG